MPYGANEPSSRRHKATVGLDPAREPDEIDTTPPSSEDLSTAAAKTQNEKQPGIDVSDSQDASTDEAQDTSTYPHGLKLAIIVSALTLGIFLVSLDNVSC